MQGIADGAEISYDQVLIANTILDIAPLFGCSLYAVSSDMQKSTKNSIIATNYFASIPREACYDVDNSFRRFDLIKKRQF